MTPIMPGSQLGSCGLMPHPLCDLGRGNRGLGGVSGASRAGYSPLTAFLPRILKEQLKVTWATLPLQMIGKTTIFFPHSHLRTCLAVS